VFVNNVSEEPGVLHADLDAFFASVEQRDHPQLLGRPVLVGGGVIVAASYEAKRVGVRTPTNERAAKALCPNAVVMPSRFDAYLEASRAVFDCFRDVTPNVEALSIDEAFLDVRGARRLLGSSLEIATQLRATVRAQVGLPLSVGIASTKFLAKVASVSAKPDGILLIPLGEELEFLHPLPVERLWGVGPKTSERLHALGITKVRQLAQIPEVALAATIGKGAAAHLNALAWNRDPRRVSRPSRRRSIGSQSALGRPRFDLLELEVALFAVVDRVARRLRADERLARTVTLRLRFADFERATRSATLDCASDSTAAIVNTARALLAGASPIATTRGVTLIGVAVSNLVAADPLQLTLPFGRANRDDRALDATIDAVHARFGTAAITRTSLIRRDRLRHSFGEPLYES
jgi:DNA polymerase-4